MEGLLGSRARPPGEPCAGPASWGAVSPPGAHGEPCAISVVWGAVYEKKQNGRVGSREHGGEVCVGSHAQKGLLGSHAQDSSSELDQLCFDNYE